MSTNEEYCEYEHPEEGCCLCRGGYYNRYKYAKGMTHYHEYCDIGRKGKHYGWWEE